MSAFLSFLRKLLDPDGTDAGAKLIDFVERHGERRLDFKGFELLCEAKRIFGDGNCLVLDQGNVVLGHPFAARSGRDLLVEGHIEGPDHERKEFLRRFRRDQGFLLFLLHFAGVSPSTREGVQP